jgi:transcription initiation factor IIF auxiliary subunit
MEQQPFEVVEGGWGEFEIGIQVRQHFGVLPSKLNRIYSCQTFKHARPPQHSVAQSQESHNNTNGLHCSCISRTTAAKSRWSWLIS